MPQQSDYSKLEHCTLCPRKCGVNRLAGQKGYCKSAGLDIHVSRAALHMWEEPCISGKNGSGTVFFTGCNLGCVYCQNRRISRDGDAGISISVKRLAEIFLELQQKKANNINLVTPTHYAVQIKEAVHTARDNGLTIPIVYNCSGYELAETIEYLGDDIQIYLTDFKYWDRQKAKEYSFAENYRAEAIKALDAMVKNAGEPEFDENGIMQRGVIVRHLVLPGNAADSMKIIGFLHRRYYDGIYLSIMNQYTPPIDAKLPEILQKSTKKDEYDSVLEYADEIGIDNLFYQEGGTVSESFIPDFDGFGVLKTNDTVI